MSVLGKIYCREDGDYEWKIEDFLSFKYIKSPKFFFKDVELFMEVSVFKEEDSLQVAIYNTKFLSGQSSRDLYIELLMNTGENNEQEMRTGTLGGSGKLRYFRWMPWTEMLRRRCQILQNGCLTIYCRISETFDVACLKTALLLPMPSKTERENGINEARSKQAISTGNAHVTDENKVNGNISDEKTDAQSKSVKSLMNALRSMLISEEDSDVVIKVQGKVFRAHKGILRARSSVFKSMFSHDMLEKHSGVVNIDDCDPEVFPDFLDHIYTGSIEIISDKNVFCLFKAADKYDIETLKEGCMVYLKKNLTVDSFCRAITLAVNYDEKDLIKLATEFFCVNSLKIIQTVEWQTFLQYNAAVGNELFYTLLSK